MRQLGCTTALYVGDDVTDEDVFALRDPRVLTVRIGKKKASSARFFLNRQPEIVQALRLIVEIAG
jgi:trehalose 6-phosphate phosphatase